MARVGGATHARLRVGRLSVSDLYLTVDDLAGLGAALTARGIVGQDLRTRRS